MKATDPRNALEALASEAGQSLASLSLQLGRNPAYLQQYLRRGSPRILPEADRRALARHFNVSESELGGPPSQTYAAVPLLDIAAAAGPGGMAEDDRVIATVPMDATLLRDAGVAASHARFVRAAGDSMEPTIRHGDRLLVDGCDIMVGVAPAVFVVRVEGALKVKRCARVGDVVELRSDAEGVATTRHPARDVTVLGRVKLLLRDSL